MEKNYIMNKTRLCICIPTYKQPESIQKFLSKENDILKRHGVDLYVYDSSPDNQTLEIVTKYIKEGKENLFYKRIDSNIPSNIKVYMIFQEAENSKYDYVWMLHDHTVFEEKALVYILEKLEFFYDFYVLNMQAGAYGIEEISTLNDFAYKTAWRLNSFGASIINIKSFLCDTDWQAMSDKYNKKKTLNYSHIGFYFERASQLKECHIAQLFCDRKDFLDFNRTKQISWSKETVRICTECWGTVIMMLPDVYTNKKDVLETQDKWFLSKYSLMVYRKIHTYNLYLFLKYKKWLKLLCGENYKKAAWIALLPPGVAFRIFNKELINKTKAIRENKGKIYIYGAGRHAAECGAYLKECNIDFDNYIVSNLEGNPAELLGHQVLVAEQKIMAANNLVIIAVLTSGVSEIEKALQQMSTDDIKINILRFGS